MRETTTHAARILIPALLLCLAACASSPSASTAGVEIPPDAVENVRTEANGDVITEYRVAGQLHAVHVKPARGPEYHLYVRDGRVLSTKPGDNPPQTYFKLFGW